MKKTMPLLGFLAMALFVIAGCHEMSRGGWGDLGGSRFDVTGTVTRNDMRYNSMAINTTGSQYVFFHDANTRVRYRNANYPVQSIQSGDEITVRPRSGVTGSGGTPIADVITVDSLGRAPGGGTRLDSLQGRVERFDGRRGTFEVRGPNNRIIIVELPSRPSRAVSDRFNQLRNGDLVNMQGRYVGGDRFELENFL
jgi:hypothetical protein